MKKSKNAFFRGIIVALLVLALCVPPVFAESAGSLLAQAREYAEAGDITRALACLDLAERVEPDNPQVDVFKAEIYLSAGDAENALASLDNALKKDPLSADAWLLRCRCDVVLKDTAALEQDLLYAEICGAEFTPEDAAAVAELYAQELKYEQAVEWFIRAGTDKLNETQTTAFSQALNATGREDMAVSLGLVSKPWRDEKLAAAFAGNLLTLEQSEFDWSACRMARLDELCIPEGDTQEGAEELLKKFEQELREGTPKLYSLSPKGDTAIIGLGNYLAALHDGVIRPIYAHWQRGISMDELKQPYIGMDRMRTNVFGADGVVWSHDGRYAVLTNFDMSFRRMYPVEPALLDIWNGDEIIIESSSRTFTKGDWFTMANACFSPDDSVLYYTLYGHVDGRNELVWLCKCDLADMKITRLQGMYANNKNADTYYPGLHMLSDGSLIAISAPGTTNVPWDVTCIAQGGSRILFGMSAGVSRTLISRKLLYSENSGWTLMQATDSMMDALVPSALIFFQPENQNFARGLQPMVMRCGLENGEIRLCIEPYDTSSVERMDEETRLKWKQSLVNIINVCLSPDGYYAFAAVSGTGIIQALLESGLVSEAPAGALPVLIDLEKCEAKFIGFGQDQLMVVPMSVATKLSPEWNGDMAIWPGIDGLWTIGQPKEENELLIESGSSASFLGNLLSAMVRAGSKQ